MSSRRSRSGGSSANSSAQGPARQQNLLQPTYATPPQNNATWPIGFKYQCKKTYKPNVKHFHDDPEELSPGEIGTIISTSVDADRNTYYLVSVTSANGKFLKVPADYINCWPEGWPCTAVRDSSAFVGPDTEPQVMRNLGRDDRGKVIKVELPFSQNGWFIINVPGKGQGHIPGWAMMVHNYNSYNIITLSSDIPLRIGPAPPAPGLTDTGLFSRAISGLLESWNAAVHLLQLSLERQDYLSDAQRRRSIVSNILSGASQAGLKNLFDTTTFTINDIRSRGTLIEHLSRQARERGGIYMIIYSGFPAIHRFHGQIVIYVGTTNHFSRRSDDHERDMDLVVNTYSHHYIARRSARNKEFIPLCYLDGPGSDAMRPFAEQVYGNLMQTELPHMLAGVSAHINNSNVYTGVEDVEQVTRNVSAKELVSVFRQIADESFAQSGWPGACRRPGFGVSQGLNYTSPLLDFGISDKINYVMTQARDGTQFYRRSPVNVSSGGRDDLMLARIRKSTAGGTVGFQLKAAEGLPQLGDMVLMCFEITPQGREHAVPYARIPNIGIFSDWLEARRLGVKIEWQDRSTGQWKLRYLQTMAFAVTPRNAPSGATDPYTKAIALIRFFTQQPIINIPAWAPDLGLAMVRKVLFSFERQEIRVENHPAALPPIPWGSMRTIEQVTQDLVNLGAQHPSDFGTFSIPNKTYFGTWANQHRTRCDGCHVYTGERTSNCLQAGDGKQCRVCRAFGRRCTFTPNPVLQNNLALRAALSPGPNIAGTIFDFDGPEVATLQQQ